MNSNICRREFPITATNSVFVSQRFAETMMQVQQQAMAGSAKSQPQMAQWMQSVYQNRPAFAYSVGINTPEGCLTVGNSSQGYASTALLAPVAVVGMLSAIAIPNFVKARATSQQNACINNLRQIDGAKNQWALEKGKKTGDVPTKEDLLPYLRSWPVCPARRHLHHRSRGRNPDVQHSRPQAALKTNGVYENIQRSTFNFQRRTSHDGEVRLR